MPFVGPTLKSKVIDPRTGSVSALDKRVEAALSRAVDLQLEMHAVLGKELWSIGWDVMVRDGIPYFVEFNINNGFYVADQTIKEVLQMIAFYEEEFNARLPSFGKCGQ